MTTIADTADLSTPKMHRPSLTPDYLPRNRLLHDLDVNRDAPLVLITGPAGFGKTTLLSAWLESTNWSAIWLSLDEGDNNLRVFVQYVVAAIQQCFPGAMRKTEALLHTITLPGEAVLAGALVNDLDAIDTPYILALNDYHAIVEPAIHGLLAQILRHPPRHFHLALATRHDPALPLNALRAQGKMAEIHAESLRFNAAESALLLQQLAGDDLPTAIVARVAEQVDGWPAGLRVAALSLRQNPRVLSAKRASMPASGELMAYLFDEVLSRAPAAIQNFLVQTSILDMLTPGLCEVVVGQQAAFHDGEHSLDYIARHGLFVNLIDTEQKVYRYHHLFQKLLQSQLRGWLNEADITALHTRASEWYVQHNQPDEALHYAFMRQDYAQATCIISRFRHQLMNNDEWQRLEHWISQCPREVVAATADLVVAEAFIAFVRFRRVECNALTRQAEVLIDALPASPEKDALSGEIAAMQAHLAFAEEANFTQCEAFARRALELAPHNRWTAHAIGWTYAGGMKHVAGDTAGGLEKAYRGLAECRDQGEGFRVQALSLFGSLHLFSGDLSGLMQSASEVLTHDRNAGAQPSQWSNHINLSRYYLGVVHYQRNALAEAEACFTTVVAQRYQSFVHCAVQSMFALSLTHQALGRADAAREMADMAAQYALEMRCTTLLPAAKAFQAQLALQQGRITDAVHMLAGRDLPVLLTPSIYLYLPFTTLPQVKLAEGTPQSLESAQMMLVRLQAYAEQQRNAPILMDVLTLQALLAEQQGDARNALSLLKRALVLAQPEGFVRIFADKGARMSGLLACLQSAKASPAFIQRIQDALAQPAEKPYLQDQLVEPLTNRELEVLALLQTHVSDKEIGAILFITHGTVKRHNHVIFQKLGVKNRREAVVKGIELGLLSAR
jgi:LuxR family maltose regulon positive regulatory protein